MTKQPPLAQAGTSFFPLFHSAILARRSALVSRLFLSTLPLSRSLHAPVTGRPLELLDLWRICNKLASRP